MKSKFTHYDFNAKFHIFDGAKLPKSTDQFPFISIFSQKKSMISLHEVYVLVLVHTNALIGWSRFILFQYEKKKRNSQNFRHTKHIVVFVSNS